MAELPPGWSVYNNDAVPMPSTEEDDQAARDAFHREQILDTLRYLAEQVDKGEIIGIGFSFIAPDGLRAGYGWTGGCETDPPLFFSNLQVFVNHFFDKVVVPHDE